MDRVPCETTCVSFHREKEEEREVEIVNKMLTIQLPPRQPPSDEKFPSCRFSESVLSRRGLHHVAGYNSLSSSYLERGVEREREVSFLFRGRVPSFPIPRVPLSPLLLSCWRGVRKHDRGGRGFFLSVSRPREESRDFKHGYSAILEIRFNLLLSFSRLTRKDSRGNQR